MDQADVSYAVQFHQVLLVHSFRSTCYSLLCVSDIVVVVEHFLLVLHYFKIFFLLYPRIVILQCDFRGAHVIVGGLHHWYVTVKVFSFIFLVRIRPGGLFQPVRLLLLLGKTTLKMFHSDPVISAVRL